MMMKKIFLINTKYVLFLQKDKRKGGRKEKRA